MYLYVSLFLSVSLSLSISLVVCFGTILLGQLKSLGKRNCEPPLVSSNEWESFIYSSMGTFTQQTLPEPHPVPGSLASPLMKLIIVTFHQCLYSC